MGRSWKMPLLSTMAALVILVHSAEEEYQRERDVSLRVAPAAPALYEQVWRSAELGPLEHNSRQGQPWPDAASDDIPRRKRKNRKPKRRPQADLQDDIADSVPSHVEEEAPQKFHPDSEMNPSEEADRPRRRRKRPEMLDSGWLKPAEVDRPLRRRGQRRKRPFAKFRPKVDEEISADPSIDERPPLEAANPEPELELEQDPPKNENHSDTALEIAPEERLNNDENNDHYGDGAQNHASKMSIEIMPQASLESTHAITESDKSIAETVRKVKSNGPIDPQKLKEILRQSKGSSLSEILQENNLSLSDLLRVRENSLSFNRPATRYQEPRRPYKSYDDEVNHPIILNEERKSSLSKIFDLDVTDPEERKTLQHDIYDLAATESPIATPSSTTIQEQFTTPRTEILDTNEDTPKMLQRRRLPNGTTRKRLRIKPPMRNFTMKFPITRQSSILNTRKQALLNRFNNAVKYTELKYPTTLKPESEEVITTTKEITPSTATSTTTSTESTTTSRVEKTTEKDIQETTTDNVADFEFKSNSSEATDSLDTTTILQDNETTTYMEAEVTTPTTTTEKPIVSPNIRAKAMTNAELRRQALTNRLKRKRQKQKNSTTETPQEDITKDLFGMINLVSASEFIAEMQTQKTTKPQPTKEISNSIDESLVTEATSRIEQTQRNTQPYSKKTTQVPLSTTTEETAKIEIAEILSDRSTGARISKILRDRNMTFDELVEHRERGSSHVHLADIFHNASREPNPPEPFLSKSSIEPLAKETYPLRALLEANLHEPAAKTTAAEASPTATHSINIPVVLDYGNNVNENSDNLGIVSLFNKISTNDLNIDETTVQQDSQGTPYVTSIVSISVPTSTESNREARRLEQTPKTLSLHDILSMLHGNFHNDTLESISTPSTAVMTDEKTEKTTETTADENLEGDSVLVVEDLQHLTDFDSSIASVTNEKIEMDKLEQRSFSAKSGTMPGSRSVTVATASIVGLTMIVFLLTYAAFKWRQQRKEHNKDNFCEERIPSPVFETRKINKNSSSRSISPMLPSSNLYTLSSLDSRNGKESPDYMWDSLRKPFQ